jgi:hypothetical protein
MSAHAIEGHASHRGPRRPLFRLPRRKPEPLPPEGPGYPQPDPGQRNAEAAGFPEDETDIVQALAGLPEGPETPEPEPWVPGPDLAVARVPGVSLPEPGFAGMPVLDGAAPAPGPSAELLERVRDGIAAIPGQPAAADLDPDPGLAAQTGTPPESAPEPGPAVAYHAVRAAGRVVGFDPLHAMPSCYGTFESRGVTYAGLWLGEDDPEGGFAVDSADEAYFDAIIIAALQCRDALRAARAAGQTA